VQTAKTTVGSSVEGPDLRSLDLRQLEVLRAIAATGSMAAAARSLHVSQPTVAHHLATLERALGSRVVDRGPRGATLTPIGQVFAERAELVLEQLASAAREARTMAQWGIPTLRIGTFSSAGGALLPAAAAEVQRRTGVRVELQEAETIELLDELDRGALNIALVYNDGSEPWPIPPGWRAEVLMWDPFLLAVPQSHALAHRSKVHLRDFADDGWILSQQSDVLTDRSLLVAAAAEGFTPRPVLRSDDFHVALGFVSTGLAIALVPRLAAEPREGVRYCEVSDTSLGRTIGVVYPEKPSKVVQLLVQRLRREATSARWST
jgi:molybdate transport repressor ModE-like protein